MSNRSYTGEWKEITKRTDTDTVVVILHGMDCSPSTIAALTQRVKKEMLTSEIYAPKLPFDWHRTFDLKDLSEEIGREIQKLIRKTKYKSVLLIGHSAGGVLVQSTYLMIQKNVEFDDVRKQFESPDLDLRLILVAPLTRGWALDHHLPVIQKISWTIGLCLLPILWFREWVKHPLSRAARQEPWIMQLRRSAPFLVWLRLAWLQFEGKKEDKDKVPIFILLGSIDELLSWQDMADAVVGVNNVVYIQVPFSDHATIIDYEDGTDGEKRAELFAHTLMGSLDSVRELKEYVLPWDEKPYKPVCSVKRVVFVIHGIRDEGHWTQKIASLAKANHELAKLERDQIVVETSSYGYFSMLEFLRRRARYEKMHWLVERYIEARRRYPKAKFSFIGHSNGTYLLAQSLEEYEDIKFERIAFAGSVVTSNFDWISLKRQNQVGYVLNFMSSKDWVVSCLPRIADIIPLSWILGPNLGGASVVPFKKKGDFVHNTEHYIKGGHGAGIEEVNWRSLAEFAVSESPMPISLHDVDSGPSYVEKAQWWYRPKVGTLTTPLTLGLVIVLFFYLMYLAWELPGWFWGTPLVVGFITAILVAISLEFSRGRAIRERKKWQKISRFIATIGLAITCLLVLFSPGINPIIGPIIGSFTGPIISSITDSIINPIIDSIICPVWLSKFNPEQSLRTISALIYIFLVSRILTKF